MDKHENSNMCVAWRGQGQEGTVGIRRKRGEDEQKAGIMESES